MLAVQPLSAFVSNHCGTKKKRMAIGNRWTRPNSGELLQTNVIETTTQQETRPKLHMYKEGTLSLLVAGRRWRGEGPASPGSGGERRERRCGSGAMGKEVSPSTISMSMERP
jgi:hypothetical protein